MLIYIKNKKEIEGFKRAGAIAAKILSKLLDSTREGVTTQDLDIIARKECKTFGVKPMFLDYRGFPAAICTSTNKVMVHGTPDNNILKYGDLLSIDMGVDLDGYIGDTAETVVIGGCKEKIVDKCREALGYAIKQAIAGNRLNDIGAAVYKVAKKNKFAIPIGYGGHGINRNVLHADPFVPNAPDRIDEDNIKLRPGMVMALEPMFIEANSGETKVLKLDEWSVVAKGVTAHCEHTILITEGLPVILTEREKA